MTGCCYADVKRLRDVDGSRKDVFFSRTGTEGKSLPNTMKIFYLPADGALSSKLYPNLKTDTSANDHWKLVTTAAWWDRSCGGHT